MIMEQISAKYAIFCIIILENWNDDAHFSKILKFLTAKMIV